MTRRPVRAAGKPGRMETGGEGGAAVPPLAVEIESAVTGWNAGQRFDVLLRGRITSAAPMDTFSIRDAGGTELAAIQFGQGDSAEAVPVGPGMMGFRTSFQAYLPLPAGEGVRFADARLRAQDRNGATYEASMRVGCMDDQAAILAGPAADLSGEDLPAPPGIVYLESAELSGGVLRVCGWTLAAAPIVAVQVFAGGQRVGAASHGRDRADVAAAYPGFANARNAGFVLERPLPDGLSGAASVTVQVLCLSGACHTASVPLFRPPEPAPVQLHTSQDEPVAGWDVSRAILLTCDQAAIVSPDVLRVEGWSACGAGIGRVAIEVDGQKEGEAEYGRPREDVAAEYPGMPVGTGYLFEKLIPGLSGRPHEIRIVATNRMGDEKDLTVPLTDPAAPEFRFELDIPATRDGVAPDPITGRMTIEGWALARDGMAGIDVALDGVGLGPAHYGTVRPDVGAAFPDWEGAVRSGYTFHCPARALPDGEHVVTLTARSRTGGTHVHEFQISVRKAEDPEASVGIRRRVSRVERDTMDAVLADLNWRPDFDVIAVLRPGVAEKHWMLTVRSLLAQSWRDWSAAVLAPSAALAEAVREVLARLAPEDSTRFRVIDPSDGEAWTGPLSSTAALTAVLALGDEPGHDALASFAVAGGLHPGADFFYADEFRLPAGQIRPEAFFKPDFSPALLEGTNYIGRPLVLRPSVLAGSGVSPASLTQDGFHDLALRCAEHAARVHHVPELLSRTDLGGMDAAVQEQAALTRALTRRGVAAEVSPGLAQGTWRVRRTGTVRGKVSIIIPTIAAKGHIETCLKTLRGITANQNFEIVCAENIPDPNSEWKTFLREHADKVLTMPPEFNWSRFNNLAAEAADGEFLLFLNDDIEVIHPEWLDVLLEDAAREGVGIVGARLLYPNRHIQHAGMFLGANGIGRHAFRHLEDTEPGYFGLAQTRREVIAVTGACLMVRREVFEALGRFDEAHDVINNDLDFCLRAHRAGFATIYTPYATLIHHELASREGLRDDFDTTRFTGDWAALFAAGDPFFNPNLSRYSDDYQIDDEGVRQVYSGHPLIARSEVKRILAVKLDHIGDFITALPAMRRLKALFPGAHLTVLAAPASTAFAAAEPAIDEFIPFEFFHSRSQLGEKDLTQDDLVALTAQLAPYRFDIAVDLRKHMSTRHILLCSGARVLAGYDSLDRYPWLDIALEWEGDKALQHKRNHITDDLLHLVAAIDAACEPSRKLFDPRPPAMTVREMPEAVRGLFVRPVIAIHPGAGNITKQWPEAHVAALIGLLIDRHDVSVLLIGGADEIEIAEAIAARCGRPDRIASAAGAVRLGDLPRLLAACALYIGNDSGPKHIAGGMGVPTIGIHSGVVDPGEWSAMGERTVALHRNMTCAPCYLAKAEDCPRGLACIRMLEPAAVYQVAQKFLARPIETRRIVPAARAAHRAPGEKTVPSRGRARRAQTVGVK